MLAILHGLYGKPGRRQALTGPATLAVAQQNRVRRRPERQSDSPRVAAEATLRPSLLAA